MLFRFHVSLSDLRRGGSTLFCADPWGGSGSVGVFFALNDIGYGLDNDLHI